MGHDVVVVGAGSAGCVLAARLAAAGRRVLLLEAGPGLPGWGPTRPLPGLATPQPHPSQPHPSQSRSSQSRSPQSRSPEPQSQSQEYPATWRAAASLAATAPGHPRNWSHPVQLRPGIDAVVPRGRGVGGSGAINGANWTWATRADTAAWGPGWSWADLVPHWVRAEHDLDLGGQPGHGDRGPVPVRRPTGALLHPSASRFLAAARHLGFPAEPDKNAGAPPGVGPVPTNCVDGLRIDAATAYRPDRAGAQIRTDAAVHRVLLDGDTVRGVVLADGTEVGADAVVLAAGAFGTPALLLRSGVGPADALRAAGVPVRHDLPGVGQGFSDHPAVFVPFIDPVHAGLPDPPVHPDAAGAQMALNLDSGADPAGDLEILAFARPFVDGGPRHLMCLLQAPDSRGEITLDERDPAGPPRIRYHYLRTEYDRRSLRHAVRTAAELLRAGVGTRVAPGGAELGTDRALDGWIAAHLSTAVHASGSAAIGRVVDAQLRVRGLRGLWVADTSVLPTAPRRGPAATAVAIGEKAAALLLGST